MDALPGVPDYGKLSRRPLDEMIAGARVDVAPYKRDPMDFVLWKPSDRATEPGWESPWGFGRPGWHIECSAMSAALLGETFDIHAGGIDLVFPHHENEIAQSCCAFGIDKMASVWMHNGFLQVEGQKMSKSLGNFVTIRDVLADWPGTVVRLNMLKTHYRQPIDWTVRGLEQSEQTLVDWGSVGEPVGGGSPDVDVLAALHDDMNTSLAISRVHRLAEEATKYAELRPRFFATLDILGVQPVRDASSDGIKQEIVDDLVKERISARLAARRAKNFAESDRIRDELLTMGIQLKDGKDPLTGEPTTTWELKR
jgi:cysteinyl-tRNA synthetase